MNMATTRNVTAGNTKKKNNTYKPRNVDRLSKDSASMLVFIRIVIILVVDIAVCWLFSELKRSPGEVEYNFYMNIRPVLFWIFLGLFILSGLYFAFTRIKGIDTSAHYVTPAMLMAITLYLAVFMNQFFYTRFGLSPYLFYTVTIIVSVLFAVYYVYTILLYRK